MKRDLERIQGIVKYKLRVAVADHPQQQKSACRQILWLMRVQDTRISAMQIGIVDYLRSERKAFAVSTSASHGQSRMPRLRHDTL